MPIALPEDMRPGGVFAMAAGPPMRLMHHHVVYGPPPDALVASGPVADAPAAPPSETARQTRRRVERRRTSARRAPAATGRTTPRRTGDWVVDTLGLLQLDGGLPGPNDETRLLRTAVFALAIVEAAETDVARMHLDRMARFLRTGRPSLRDARLARALDVVCSHLAAHTVPQGAWKPLWERLADEAPTALDEARQALLALADA